MMTSQELTSTKLKELPSLTDSDCSSGESAHEQSESEESQDEEEEMERRKRRIWSGIGKAQDDDEVRLNFFDSGSVFMLMNISFCYRPSCLIQRTRVPAAVRAS